MRCFLAIDIGASSGRHIVGWRENGEIRTDEIYRFPNGVKQMGGHLIWDMEQLPEDVKAGITAAKAKYPRIESLSISQETNMKAAFDAAANGGLRTMGDYFRCAYRSLAESYRVALEELERNTGKKYSRLYIPLMDNGHYHPAEVVSDKIPALLSALLQPVAEEKALQDGGKNAQLLWGFTDGGKFTSEFPAHMLRYAARLSVNPDNRMVMHCRPANLLAMTHVHDLDSRAFTRTLWQMCTECIVVFPDGVSVLPWMLCGTNEIGVGTAEQMKTARLMVWSLHGIYGAGADLDEPHRDCGKGGGDLHEDRPPAVENYHHR